MMSGFSVMGGTQDKPMNMYRFFLAHLPKKGSIQILVSIIWLKTKLCWISLMIGWAAVHHTGHPISSQYLARPPSRFRPGGCYP